MVKHLHFMLGVCLYRLGRLEHSAVALQQELSSGTPHAEAAALLKEIGKQLPSAPQGLVQRTGG